MPWERFELSTPFYGDWILSPACIPFHHHGLQRFCDLVILTGRRLFLEFVTSPRCGFPALTPFGPPYWLTTLLLGPETNPLYDENGVPQEGIEPSRPYGQGILSPPCLPIPPPGHIRRMPFMDTTRIELVS